MDIHSPCFPIFHIPEITQWYFTLSNKPIELMDKSWGEFRLHDSCMAIFQNFDQYSKTNISKPEVILVFNSIFFYSNKLSRNLPLYWLLHCLYLYISFTWPKVYLIKKIMISIFKTFCSWVIIHTFNFPRRKLWHHYILAYRLN